MCYLIVSAALLWKHCLRYILCNAAVAKRNKHHASSSEVAVHDAVNARPRQMTLH